jgi:hypothetical protein
MIPDSKTTSSHAPISEDVVRKPHPLRCKTCKKINCKCRGNTWSEKAGCAEHSAITMPKLQQIEIKKIKALSISAMKRNDAILKDFIREIRPQLKEIKHQLWCNKLLRKSELHQQHQKERESR